MERREYRIERIRTGASGSGSELVHALNQFADEGWRLVDAGSTLTLLAHDGFVSVLLEREAGGLPALRRLMMPGA